MTTVLFDSTDVAAIPADAPAVAGYVDGIWPTFEALASRFPNVPRVSITVQGRAGVMVADVENGDLTPATAATWAKNELAGGRVPTLYCSKGNYPQVVAALDAEGVSASDVHWWLADWTGAPHLIPGSVATQWANPPASGGDYDVSVALQTWLPDPTPPPAPAPAPPPAPKETPSMIILEDGESQFLVFANGTKLYIPPAALAALSSVVPAANAPVPPSFVQSIPTISGGPSA